MESLQLTQMPEAKTAMLIRRPVAEVFEAFINPAITSTFWFTRGSGRLEKGQEIQWEWEMYDASVQVSVLAIEQHKRILVEWLGYGTPTTVEWIFTAPSENTTFVSITNTGFSGTGDERVKQAISSTEGFTFVLSGLKAFLEHNILLNLVADRHPRGRCTSYLLWRRT
jgi:uncharacterized protein YndB with AHSA1/START domain